MPLHLYLRYIVTAALTTLSKPIVARLTTEAEIQPRFRNLLINMGQANYWISSTVRRSHGLAMDSNIPPLTDEKAVQSAASLMGVTSVVGVGGATLLYVMNKSDRREVKFEEYCIPEREKMRQEQPLAKLSYEPKLLNQELKHVNQQLAKQSDKRKLVHQEVKELKRGIEELVVLLSPKQTPEA
ncbi:hypothetical protein CASFOL_032358 [Castilleja foliolosa]|uniref:OPA3-like protein n=1 Tax=Castilleja foliolosa TaxID=1961234 RepID=A0ABD3C1V8_9LAMI